MLILTARLTVKVCVGLAGDVGARAEVDELHLGDALGDVDEDVLVLDVAVDDAALVAGQHRPQHLSPTLAITNGPDFLLIGRACRVCRIWFDRDQSEDSRVVPIVPDTAYMTGMTNRL